MPNSLRSLAAIEQSLQADVKLAELAIADEIVERWRQADTEFFRTTYAELYSEWLGVPPDAHELFRQQLEALRDHGGGTVELIAQQIRQQFQLNGGLELPPGN